MRCLRDIVREELMLVRGYVNSFFPEDEAGGLSLIGREYVGCARRHSGLYRECGWLRRTEVPSVGGWVNRFDEWRTSKPSRCEGQPAARRNRASRVAGDVQPEYLRVQVRETTQVPEPVSTCNPGAPGPFFGPTAPGNGSLWWPAGSPTAGR